jgi:hypothetical protein
MSVPGILFRTTVRRKLWLGGLLAIAAQGVAAEEEMSRSVRLLDRAPASVALPAQDPAKLVPPADQTLPPLSPASQPATSVQTVPGLADNASAQQTMTAPPPAPASAIFSQDDDGAGPIKVANPAEISVEMLPGQTVNIGSRVRFRISSKKAGYLVLVDIDANGRLTQIYPNTASLIRVPRQNANYLKPGTPLLIPSTADPYGGIEYVISPPAGKAMIVAILSEQPVQILDLPDIPEGVKGQTAALNYLTKWTGELRIPESATGRLREARWSFDAKFYAIE